jgi:hypothetical protein
MVPSIAARPVDDEGPLTSTRAISSATAQKSRSSAVANSEREDGLSHERDDATSLRELTEPLPGRAR